MHNQLVKFAIILEHLGSTIDRLIQYAEQRTATQHWHFSEELVDLLEGIGKGVDAERFRDILGWVYEYFLGVFTGAKGRREGKTL